MADLAGGCAKRMRRQRSTAPQNASGSLQDTLCSSGRSRAASPVRPRAHSAVPWQRVRAGVSNPEKSQNSALEGLVGYGCVPQCHVACNAPSTLST